MTNLDQYATTKISDDDLKTPQHARENEIFGKVDKVSIDMTNLDQYTTTKISDGVKNFIVKSGHNLEDTSCIPRVGSDQILHGHGKGTNMIVSLENVINGERLGTIIEENMHVATSRGSGSISNVPENRSEQDSGIVHGENELPRNDKVCNDNDCNIMHYVRPHDICCKICRMSSHCKCEVTLGNEAVNLLPPRVYIHTDNIACEDVNNVRNINMHRKCAKSDESDKVCVESDEMEIDCALSQTCKCFQKHIYVGAGQSAYSCDRESDPLPSANVRAIKPANDMTDCGYDESTLDREITVMTLEDIRRETEADQVLSEVKLWLTSKKKPTCIQNTSQAPELITLWKIFDLLSLDNGIIYRKWVALKEPHNFRSLIVIPHALQEKLLVYYHCGLLSLHSGIETCLENCLKIFWWPKCKKEFKLFISSCVKCNAIKAPGAYLRAPLKVQIYGTWNDAIAIDHIVPSATTSGKGGFRYILTIVECFSNYLVAVPVRTQSAEETISVIIKQYILKHGIPLSILHDLHQNFCSYLFRETLAAFGIKDTRTTSFKSSTNGRCERQQRRINQALRAVVPVGKPHLWPDYLPYVVSALNTLKNKHTGFSANFVCYGKELRYPQQFFMDLDVSESDHELIGSRKSTAYNLYRTIKNTYYKVRQNAARQAGYMKKQYDKRVKFHDFKDGDLCFVLDNTPEHKFSPRFFGPKVIKKKINDHLYLVLMDPERGETKVINIQKMKPYHASRFTPVLRRPDVTNPDTAKPVRPVQPTQVDNQEDIIYLPLVGPHSGGGIDQEVGDDVPHSGGQQMSDQRIRPVETDLDLDELPGHSMRFEELPRRSTRVTSQPDRLHYYQR